MVLSVWDIILLAAVTGFAVLTAYIENPVRKTFILMLPLPFSIAVMSLGNKIDATNVTALLILNLYYHSVRILHYRFKVNIFIAITIGAIGYCLLGAGLAMLLSDTSLAFWISAGIVICVSVILYRVLPNPSESGYRTKLPLYFKIPMTVLVVCIIVLIKNQLLGFMTLFPMVGVFATYETRKSLRTTCKQVPILSLVMVLMLIIIRLTQENFALSTALLFGWAGLLAVLIPYFIYHIKSQGTAENG